MAALCCVFIVLTPSIVADADSLAQDYASGLDGNGKLVYDAVSERFREEMADPASDLSFDIVLSGPMLFDSTEDAMAYARDTVNSALASIYYTDATAIWLWDLPVKAVEIDVDSESVRVSSTQSGWASEVMFMPTHVRFTVSVPEDMRDDEATEANEISGYLNEVSDRVFQVFGSDSEKVVAIAKRFTCRLAEDPEGEVSNVYDALVTGHSSYAGIAAAFGYLCQQNGVQSMVVKGTVYASAGDEEGTTRYWNAVLDSEAGLWYGSDYAIYDGDDRLPLMAGVSTVLASGSAGAFSATHVAELDLASENSLTAPEISQRGYEWPDDRTFFEKWGTHIMVTAIVILIMVGIIYAARTGSL